MANIYLPGHGSRNANAGVVAAGGGYYAPVQGRVMGAAPVARRRFSQGAAGAAAGPLASSYGALGAAPAVRGGFAGGTAAGGAVGAPTNSAGGMGGLAGAFGGALDAANAANDARYNDVLNRNDLLWQRGMGELNKMGQAEKMAIAERLGNEKGQISQNMVSRGLSASTSSLAPLMAAQRESNFANADLAERLARQRLDFDKGVTFNRLGVMERREDEGPDMGMLARLSEGMGQYGGGGGGFAAPFMGGGFGQVGFGGPQLGGGFGGGQVQRPNWTKINALQANKGNFAYNSGYSKGGAGGYFGPARSNQIAASQPFINRQVGAASAYA